MSDDKDKLINLIIGFALGAIAALIIIKMKESKEHSLETEIKNISQNPSNIENISSIPNTEELLDRIRKLELRFESNSQAIMPSSTMLENIPQPNIYKNNEKWKILRNTEGDIEELEVLRDARRS